MILGGAKASLAHVVIFLPLQLEGVTLTRNCTFWVLSERRMSLSRTSRGHGMIFELQILTR
jgi:hypothetical protein